MHSTTCYSTTRVSLRVQHPARPWKWSFIGLRIESRGIPSFNSLRCSWHPIHPNLPIQLLWMCWISSCFNRCRIKEQNICHLWIHQCYWDTWIRRRIRICWELPSQRREGHHLCHQQSKWWSWIKPSMHQCLSLQTNIRSRPWFKHRLRNGMVLYLLS